MPAERPIRLLLSGSLAFGPGKAELLEKIELTGSVQAAASAMEMSYMKAWKIVKNLNQRFADPLVFLQRGGNTQGGATLTPAGREILALYHEAVTTAEVATHEVLEKMRLKLAPDESISSP